MQGRGSRGLMATLICKTPTKGNVLSFVPLLLHAFTHYIAQRMECVIYILAMHYLLLTHV